MAMITFLLFSCFSTAFKFSKTRARGEQSVFTTSTTALKAIVNSGIDPGSVKLQAQEQPNAELMALVRPTPNDPFGVYSHALEIMKSVQKSPSCNQEAAAVLMNSCQSLEGSEHDAEGSTEDFRSIYAAQLAICEIGSANSLKPQCDSLTATVKGKSKAAESIRKDQLSRCLHSLQSRPQWWTSYSNNRQNAAVLCQATRIDIEKGKSLEASRSLN